VRILVDPWLVEELVFAGQSWLYRGKKTHIPPLNLNKVVEGVDAIILSQAWPIWSMICLPAHVCTLLGITWHVGSLFTCEQGYHEELACD
jgi:hypothetical protein